MRKGQKHTRETIEKMGRAISLGYKNMSKKDKNSWKEKMSKAINNPKVLEPMREKCRIASTGKNNAMYGKKHSTKTKQKIRESTIQQWKNMSQEEKERMKENCRTAFTGRHHTSETKRKIREKFIERQKKMFGKIWCPNIGDYEMSILNKLEKKYNLKIQRQYKVAGYFLDGYIPELNIAFEVDEPHHFKEDKLSNYDIRRQKEIEDELKCKFIRIKIQENKK